MEHQRPDSLIGAVNASASLLVSVKSTKMPQEEHLFSKDAWLRRHRALIQGYCSARPFFLCSCQWRTVGKGELEYLRRLQAPNVNLNTDRKDDSSTQKGRKSVIWKRALVVWEAAPSHFISGKLPVLESVRLCSAELRGEASTRKM